MSEPQKSPQPFQDIRGLLSNAAKRHARAAAFLENFGGTRREISYARFRIETEALGSALTSLLPQGSRVLVLGENCYCFALSLMALWCGGWVPIPLESDTSATAIAEMIRQTGARGVIYSSRCRDKVARLTHFAKISFEEVARLADAGETRLRNGGASAFDREIDREKPAAVFYTEQSGGELQGVVLNQATLCRAAESLDKGLKLTASRVFLSVLPLSSPEECVCGLLLPVSRGDTVVFGGGEAELGRDLMEIQPEMVVLSAALAVRLYDALAAERKKRKGNSVARARKLLGTKLERLLIVGGQAGQDVITGFAEWGVTATETFGLAECGGVLAVRDPQQADSDGLQALAGGMFEICPTRGDGSGEIRYRGDRMTYALTNTEVPDSHILQDGWLYTGMIGKITGQALYVLGAKAREIETAEGEYIHPAALEEALLRSPLVREAAVFEVYDRVTQDRVAAACIYPDLAYAVEAFGAPQAAEKLDCAISEWVDTVNKKRPSGGELTLYALWQTPLPRNARGEVEQEELQKAFAALKEY